MKKYVLTFICTITLVLIGSTTLLAADLTCARDAAGLITSRVECGTQPDEQYITIKRIAFCTQSPTLVDAPASVISTTGCTDVFVSSTGAEILITPTGATLPSFIDPPAGTYTHAYFELSPDFRVKTIQRFRAADGIPSGTAGFVSGTGTFCWSLNGVINNARETTPHRSQCNTAEPAAAAVGITTSHFNAISNLNGIADPDMFIGDGTFGMALLNANRALLPAADRTGNGVVGNEAMIAAWKAITITTYGPGLTSYVGALPNTRGTNVNFSDGGANITNFGAADLDFILTTSRTGGSN